MKRIAASTVLTFLSGVLIARAQDNQERKAGLRRLRVSKPFAYDSSRSENTEGLSDFLFAELGEEDKKLWIDLIHRSESMSTSTPTP
jgi:hypothetical protein